MISRGTSRERWSWSFPSTPVEFIIRLLYPRTRILFEVAACQVVTARSFIGIVPAIVGEVTEEILLNTSTVCAPLVTSERRLNVQTHSLYQESCSIKTFVNFQSRGFFNRYLFLHKRPVKIFFSWQWGKNYFDPKSCIDVKKNKNLATLDKTIIILCGLYHLTFLKKCWNTFRQWAKEPSRQIQTNHSISLLYLTSEYLTEENLYIELAFYSLATKWNQ